MVGHNSPKFSACTWRRIIHKVGRGGKRNSVEAGDHGAQHRVVMTWPGDAPMDRSWNGWTAAGSRSHDCEFRNKADSVSGGRGRQSSNAEWIPGRSAQGPIQTRSPLHHLKRRSSAVMFPTGSVDDTSVVLPQIEVRVLLPVWMDKRNMTHTGDLRMSTCDAIDAESGNARAWRHRACSSDGEAGGSFP